MIEFEVEVWQDGSMQAGASMTDAKAALNEAARFAAVYGRDGPVEVRFYVKQSATREELEKFAS